MKNFIKLLPILSSILIINGCVQKQADGTYPNTYSYHPYNQNPSSSIKEIEKIAMEQIGKKYKWGANGPEQFDCSGFTKFVYAKQGIPLPRISKEQAKVGQLIRFNNLKKGDLLFFDSKRSSTVSHTGIYLGDNKFIHASSTKHSVVISRIDTSYYKEHFKWGRRFILN